MIARATSGGGGMVPLTPASFCNSAIVHYMATQKPICLTPCRQNRYYKALRIDTLALTWSRSIIGAADTTDRRVGWSPPALPLQTPVVILQYEYSIILRTASLQTRIKLLNPKLPNSPYLSQTGPNLSNIEQLAG